MISSLHHVLAAATSGNASDVHIKEGSPVAYRIDGEILSSDFSPDRALLETFLSEVANEKQIASFWETGDLDLSHREDDVGRFRVNIHRQRNYISINFRWVKNLVMSVGDLGLPDTLERIAEMPRGIIIMTGTTGSGKSTTLAAMLEHINQIKRSHIITIEDPIEYEFEDKQSIFEQREVGIDTISFGSALKHALRQDPDVIMVGEMRDRESFDAALQAADTGHLVISTLHASNATQTINRILDFYEKAEQEPIREALAINLRAVISQRLVPRAEGKGRAPACEIMLNSPIVTKLLQEDRLERLPAAVEAGRQEGMLTFNQCLLDLVNNGIVTEEDAIEASDNPEGLRMNFEGIFLSSGNGGIIG